MVLHMFEKCKNKHLEYLDLVSCDCCLLGIFYGFRLSKWVQSVSEKKQHLAIVENLPLALIFPDLTFLGDDIITNPQSCSAELHGAGIKFAQLKWRAQEISTIEKMSPRAEA